MIGALFAGLWASLFWYHPDLGAEKGAVLLLHRPDRLCRRHVAKPELHARPGGGEVTVHRRPLVTGESVGVGAVLLCYCLF